MFRQYYTKEHCIKDFAPGTEIILFDTETAPANEGQRRLFVRNSQEESFSDFQRFKLFHPTSHGDIIAAKGGGHI